MKDLLQCQRNQFYCQPKGSMHPTIEDHQDFNHLLPPLCDCRQDLEMKKSYFPELECHHIGTEEGLIWEKDKYVHRQ